MLNDLDRTLEELLERELPLDILSSAPLEEIPPDTISFAAPDKDLIKVKPAINFFLYDVRENLELRSNEWSLERQSNGTATRKRPAARVDCSYLITAWPSDPSDWATEHRLLGAVMKILLRYPRIPEDVLQGSLQGQEPPLRATSLRPPQLNSLGEFWQAMGGKPKAALNYTVTIAVPIQDIAEFVPLVVDRQI
jgi:Pvc16 N-terminal domain